MFCVSSDVWPQEPADAHEQFTIMMYLKKRRWTLEEKLEEPPVPVKSIVGAFLTRFDAYKLVRQRRRTLRALYAGNRHKFQPEPIEPIRAAAKVGRNDPCPCGSGKKYKKCCGR